VNELNFAVRLGLAERFCSRRGSDSDPQVGRVALLSAGVTAYKPHHYERPDASPAFRFFIVQGPDLLCFRASLQFLTAAINVFQHWRVRKTLAFIFAFLLAANVSICRADQAQKDEGFRELFATLFSQWDANHDGILDLKELNAAIENPNVRESDAAVAVYLHRHLQVEKEGQSGLSLAEVLALGSNPQIQKNISGKAWHIVAIDHSVFAPGDPNLATFHQGGIGDCYLLAVIGAFAFHHPEIVRTMIQQTNGGFQVRFGNGRTVNVGALTDAELIMGASEGRNHGVWLSVLEKAFAQIDFENKERKIGTNIEADDAVMTDFIGHGGYYSPVMTLFTGHKVTGAPLSRWVNQDPNGGLERAHELLAKLSVEHKLMAAGCGNKTKRLPKGIVHGHVYGILGYDPASRMVVVFNPWGNHFKPKGEPGLVNGYPTDHGIFQVPLNEFIQTFTDFAYETDRPAIAAHQITER